MSSFTTMSATVEKVVSDALSLSPQARALVAEHLIKSLDSNPGEPLSSAWEKELSKRCTEIDQGTVDLIEAEKVFARAISALS
jgi:putative addiction module component (TIGR02574 family)